MPKEIETFKTILIKNIFGNNQSSFRRNINIEFIPDEIVLKHVAMSDDNANAEEGNYLIKSNIIDQYELISIPANSMFCESVDIPFKNSKPITGDFEFTISKINGNAPTQIATMNLSISLTLLLIKFKSS